jgi:hypothetical protein
MLNPIDLEKEGFDSFGRHIMAPLNRKIPITFKDVFQGEKVIYTQGNVQPRSVNRFNVSLDVLLSKFDFVLTGTRQISTGYDWSQNNYIFVVTWDGTNYYLRRYNTLDFAVPSQDGYSVNIPTVNNIYGVAVLYNRVVVIGSDTGGNKAWYYDFGLNFQSAETKNAPTNPVTGTFTSDGKNLYFLDSANNLLRVYNGVNYTLSTSYSWPTAQYSPTPNRLLCFDRVAFWAFDTTNKKVVRFRLNSDGSITVLMSFLFPEDVYGIMFLKGMIFISYQQGSLLTSIPLIL